MGFDVPYAQQADRAYKVRFRDILPAVLDVVEDNSLGDRLMLYPERRYISHPDGGLMRIWEEYSSGDDWWDLQVSYSSPIQLYSHSIDFFESDTGRQWYNHSISANIFRFHARHLFWKRQILECIFVGWKCAESRSQWPRRSRTCDFNRIPSYCEFSWYIWCHIVLLSSSGHWFARQFSIKPRTPSCRGLPCSSWHCICRFQIRSEPRNNRQDSQDPHQEIGKIIFFHF